MTFVSRLIGASALDAATYEEVEADRTSTGQAMGVVLMSAAAAGIGARGFGRPAKSGVRLLPGPDTHADVTELLRTIGFASAPGVLRLLGVIPGLTAPIFGLTAVWMVLAMTVAIRQALDYTSTTRALAVCALAWGLTLFFIVVLGLLASPAIS